MAQMGAEIRFDKEKCIVLKDNKQCNIGHISDEKLYRVNTLEYAKLSATSSASSLGLWHCRLGHLNYNYVDCLVKKELVHGMKYSNDNFDNQCEACTLGKMYKLPIPKHSLNRATQPLELVHTDVCGPINVDSIGGSKYMLIFTYDYTRYITVYFITSKADVLSKFKECVNMVENRTGLQVKRLSIFLEKENAVLKLRSDNGGEYNSQEFVQFCKGRGISSEFTWPYTPEQNGVSERINCTLTEIARLMIYHAKIPLKFWAEAVNTAIYLRNRSSISALKDKTSFESWFGEKSDVSNLRVFGCICFVHMPDNLRKELNPKSTKAIFVGYPLGTKGYNRYDLSSKCFIRGRNVLF